MQLKTTLEKKISEKTRPRKRKPAKKPPFRGKWILWSDKDHHWNTEGTSEVGGDHMPEEIEAKIEELKEKFGQPPDDLSWTYKLD